MVLSRRLKWKWNSPSSGCSSSQARKFGRAFLVTTRSFPPTSLHCIEPSSASHLLASYTLTTAHIFPLPLFRPTLPTLLPLMTGPPDLTSF